jgi:acyl-coenzyme A thioesterase PaaI-like protein
MKRFLFWIFNVWPPFLGAGITVRNVSPDLLSMETRLKARPWTRTLHNAQFGGSIFAMTDPIYAAILSVALGRRYAVWDQTASIRFLKPGRQGLVARFAVTHEEVTALRTEMEQARRTVWSRTVDVVDAQGTVVATVEKNIHIRRLG